MENFIFCAEMCYYVSPKVLVHQNMSLDEIVSFIPKQPHNFELQIIHVI